MMKYVGFFIYRLNQILSGFVSIDLDVLGKEIEFVNYSMGSSDKMTLKWSLAKKLLL